MKENAVEMCLLFDFYGAILTPRQQEIFDLYYNDDLSLAEISEMVSISRQGVRDAVTRSVNVLQDMERRLGLVARFRDTNQTLRRISQLAAELMEQNNLTFRSVPADLKLAEICRLTRQMLPTDSSLPGTVSQQNSED